MSSFTEGQIYFSSAEDEINYFIGREPLSNKEIREDDILPPGVYRVLDGRLYRVDNGPLFLTGESASGSHFSIG
jgi:hypothetical protein